MSKYAVYGANDEWLFDIYADDAGTALKDAVAHNPGAVRVELVSQVDRGMH